MRSVQFEWDGEAMRPLKRFMPLCDKQFVVGELYYLAPEEQRSMRSHRHYFAALRDVWDSLPEQLAGRFPSVEHLRKWLLVHTGWCNEFVELCRSEERAHGMAKHFREMDEYAIISIEPSEPEKSEEAAIARAVGLMGRKLAMATGVIMGEPARDALRAGLEWFAKELDQARQSAAWIVRVRRAKSQAVSEMGAEDFKMSKEQTLDLASSMIGVSRGELQRNAGRGA